MSLPREEAPDDVVDLDLHCVPDRDHCVRDDDVHLDAVHLDDEDAGAAGPLQAFSPEGPGRRQRSDRPS